VVRVTEEDRLPDRRDEPAWRRKRYTGFGKAVRMVMLDRDIPSWTMLSEIIDVETGRRYSPQTLSKYAAGTVEVPSEFVVSFAEALGLLQAERRDLAEQNAYHSLPEDLEGKDS
jgi:hypothetical protein